jgi:hypothetical protein
MDRALVTEMVEDYWRVYVPAAQRGDAAGAFGARREFQARVDETAAALAPIERAAFLQWLDAERNRLLDEYESDPGALKQRLGLRLSGDRPGAGFITLEDEQGRAYSGRPNHAQGPDSDLGKLVVGTAVRATVWETVRAVFRAFRR